MSNKEFLENKDDDRIYIRDGLVIICKKDKKMCDRIPVESLTAFMRKRGFAAEIAYIIIGLVVAILIITVTIFSGIFIFPWSLLILFGALATFVHGISNIGQRKNRFQEKRRNLFFYNRRHFVRCRSAICCTNSFYLSV